MAQEAQRALARGQTLERAHQRAKRMANRVARVDARVSLGRLLGSVVYLAVVASFFSRWDAAGKILAILSFVGFFVLLSRLHGRLQARASLWRALAATYDVSLLRWRRDFDALAKHHSPWHPDIARGVPKGHLYAHDLDLPRQVFGLLDGGACVESSRSLFDQLLTCALPPGTAGPEFPASAFEEERRKRAPLVASLVRRTPLQRKLEAIRLREETLQEYHAYREDGHEGVFEKAAERFRAGVPPSARLAFAAASVLAWGVFLIPAWKAFLATAQFDGLFSGLLKFAPFPLLGLVLFTPVMDGCRLISRKSRVLLSLFEAMADAHIKDEGRGESKGEGLPGGEAPDVRREARAVVSRLRSLQRALTLMEMRGNPVLWFFLHVLVPFDALAAAWLEIRARQTLPELARWWKEAVGFDVAVQLARFAHENPEFSFVDESTGRDEFFVRDLGHPALPISKRVVNDFRLHRQGPVVLLTGSNMAGKSTFLRTLGVNVVLSRLGAPVCASEFRSGISSVLCAIRIDDSLEEATSYFYAEVKRLRSILEHLAPDASEEPGSALFLVDEIFRGTNNRERFLGSWHVIRALLGTRSFGLVSTHDLALCGLGERDGRLTNMHFREHVEDGRLAFDYRLRSGPCPTTNALFIMRLEGLPIPENPEVGG